ncbi:MAG: toxin-antitoxin system YwqK family antitoxin [Psychroserpens sp.]|uniref:toxin-antitoxin system YwqK family antitoxin n=1 Tax=Psychroserpens sp. TaxID=2020870 RepID=UPI003C7750AD
MKTGFWILLLLGLITIGCNQQTEKSTQSKTMLDVFEGINVVILKSSIKYNNKMSLWTLNNEPYSGLVVSYYEYDSLKEKFGVLDGKKQGQHIQWFADGHLKNITNYDQGKLHGSKKIWASDSSHILLAQLNYSKGKPDGEQKKWYATGELHKKLNFNEGKEEGIQKGFRKNGTLYANYEAKEGRIFGLKKAALCYGLEDEKVTYKN